MSDSDKFLLIDGHAIIYRAFYAIPNLTSPQGKMVNAVYGFMRILLTALNQFEPEYIAVTYDLPKPTFRHKEFKEYKAHRAEMPDDLKPQISQIKELVKAFNMPQFELEGYEADDLIGTLSDQAIAHEKDLLSIIVTGDQDSFQLVDDQTHVWLPARGKFQTAKEYDAAAVKEKIGVTPAQVVDLKALMGDSSDNIPGIKGIGPKTAIKLITEFNNIESLFEYIEKNGGLELVTHPVLKGSTLKKIVEGKESAFASKSLATIDQKVPIKLTLEDCRVSGYDKQKVIDVLNEYDFKSLIHLLPDDEFELDLQQALF